MKRVVLIGLSVLGVLVLGGATVAHHWTRRSNVVAVRSISEEERAPAGQRVRVQVLNATKTRGLGRRAAIFLRDRGFDVVEVGTLNQQRDSTLVLDLSGHPEWAKRIAAAFAGARVEARRDSSRYLDVTVLVGASWRPPAEPFYP
jgi:LytR cell envelope-related transcriptional attenuator